MADPQGQPPPLTGNENTCTICPTTPDPGGRSVPKPPDSQSGLPGLLPKSDTNLTWGLPAGLPMRSDTDESLQIFRRALGISPSRDPSSLEAGRRAAPGGIYRAVIEEQRRKRWKHATLSVLVYSAHIAQIVIGAGLTALGPLAGEHSLAITALGAVNTILAGVLALVKGQGLPERLRKDEVEFRRLQDWIEETEALVAAGVIGRDRREAGILVESAFKKYNAAKASEENNKPDNYVRQHPEGVDRERKKASRGSEASSETVGDQQTV